MDIKKIVENTILKHLLTKEMPDEINISCTSKIDNHKYGIVTTVEDLAGEIADDIKKELKLVGRLDTNMNGAPLINWISKDLSIRDYFNTQYAHEIMGYGAFKNKANIYIEEI